MTGMYFWSSFSLRMYASFSSAVMAGWLEATPCVLTAGDTGYTGVGGAGEATPWKDALGIPFDIFIAIF